MAMARRSTRRRSGRLRITRASASGAGSGCSAASRGVASRVRSRWTPSSEEQSCIDDVSLEFTAHDAARDAAACTAAARLQAVVRGWHARGTAQRLKRARGSSNDDTASGARVAEAGTKQQRAEGTPAAMAPASERVSFSAAAQRALFETPPPSPARDRRQDRTCVTPRRSPTREHHASTPPSAVPKGWTVLGTGRVART